MVVPTIGSVVTLPFPFSDLSQTKLRPAVVLAGVGRGDWILCQITSNAYADPNAVTLAAVDFASGALPLVSYARPGKVFTANQSLLAAEIGVLNSAAYKRVAGAVIALIQANI